MIKPSWGQFKFNRSSLLWKKWANMRVTTSQKPQRLSIQTKTRCGSYGKQSQRGHVLSQSWLCFRWKVIVNMLWLWRIAVVHVILSSWSTSRATWLSFLEDVSLYLHPRVFFSSYPLLENSGIQREYLKRGGHLRRWPHPIPKGEGCDGIFFSSLRCKLTAEELALLCRSWHLYRLAVCSEDCSDLYVGETLLSRIRILAREGRWF